MATRNQIYGIPDGIDPSTYYAANFSDQQGYGGANVTPGGMDPANRAMLAQLLNGTLTGDFTSLGQFGAPGGNINDAALNQALQQRYGTQDVLSRFSDTGGFVTGNGINERELYKADGQGGYTGTGDKLTTENDVNGDLIATLLTVIGGPVAGAYGSAAYAGAGGAAAGMGGMTAAEIAAAETAAAAYGGTGLGTVGSYAGTIAGLTEAEMAAVAGASASAGSGGAGSLASYYGGTGGVDGSLVGSGVTNAGYGAGTAAPVTFSGSGGGGFLSSLGNAIGGTGTWGDVASAAGTALGGTSLGDWAKLATVAAGAAQGSQGGGGDTTSVTKQMDPRMAALFYGTGPTDPNSIAGAGLLNWQQNKSGINDTMRQGMDAQKALYTNGQPVSQVNQVAQGLLGGSVAGNPFTQGTAQLGQYHAPQGLLAQQPQQGLLGPQDDELRRMKALPINGRRYA